MSYLKRLGLRAPNYDKTPAVAVPPDHAASVWTGWADIGTQLREALPATGATVVAVECYPGVDTASVAAELAPALGARRVIQTTDLLKDSAVIEAMVAPFLGGEDPLFGFLNTKLGLQDFLDAGKVAAATTSVAQQAEGKPILIVGAGASLVAPTAALLVYADMPRWEGQLRQRRGEADNLGTRNRGLKAPLQYKRSFYVDWRVADRHKEATMARWDFLLDTTNAAEPKLITGAAHLAGLQKATSRPIRLVPFFDPGVWGGQWMRELCKLPDGPPNYAWCFDCVPEENSLLLEFAGGVRVEIPSLNLVLNRPAELLGEPVYGRFGAEFPIRFDFLDTMGGDHLSFQVHPVTAFAREQFGLSYTQDESYYILDAEPGAVVYLGCNDGVSPGAMLDDLRAAARGEKPFDDERFAARFPAKRHDHFLIPAGTLHCSGADSMVLEISATPYMATFKLWDWDRLGLDGKPRPLNIDRGEKVIRWDRDASYAKQHLVNQFEPLGEGAGWREERTGLHPAEFIETRRHWFTDTVPHDTGGAEAGGVNVLNLVQGEEAVVESPTGAFDPFVVHFAETFIIPAAVGPYTIRPAQPNPATELATLKAFVRTRA